MIIDSEVFGTHWFETLVTLFYSNWMLRDFIENVEDDICLLSSNFKFKFCIILIYCDTLQFHLLHWSILVFGLKSIYTNIT